jgi:NAD(P)-dependent dehydrogenase (short-subunit alcohol dehydrogenase family)
MDNRLQDRVAVITGGDSGVGLAFYDIAGGKL